MIKHMRHEEPEESVFVVDQQIEPWLISARPPIDATAWENDLEASMVSVSGWGINE